MYPNVFGVVSNLAFENPLKLSLEQLVIVGRLEYRVVACPEDYDNASLSEMVREAGVVDPGYWVDMSEDMDHSI